MVHGMEGHAPELGVAVFRVEGDRLPALSAGNQPQAAAAALQATQQEGTAMADDHQHPRTGPQAAVNHQQVAVKDAVTGHGIAAHPHEEGGEGAGDELEIEIDPGLDIVVGGTGEPGRDRFAHQGTEPQTGELPVGDRHTGREGEERGRHGSRT